MRTIFYDLDFKCHTSNDGTMTPVQTDFFDGKCDAFVEGYRYVPDGKSWTRADGMVFTGEPLIIHWKPLNELDSAQREYERQLIAEYESSSILTADLQKAYDAGVASA